MLIIVFELLFGKPTARSIYFDAHFPKLEPDFGFVRSFSHPNLFKTTNVGFTSRVDWPQAILEPEPKLANSAAYPPGD